ncbi:hypothetical protein PPL_10301 [Heterostelium album PN500]|uniref:Uncharacterized protein n=1 Tax=Heterostelium pallidum (strain ATCC 26659 / Pp 5 / PN500) TaxID=670386 RepID=D3BQW3_HETP5|nr:hypothetical protein PPL_10301 [Heterostelium album PN500]EFA76533.1 hypothetical protein PPL_10301 [Heterostelium album PN500]|eukprot:XP_020428665.1 hypothetical protein PPL_10301 [Heterostelium album PN500]
MCDSPMSKQHQPQQQQHHQQQHQMMDSNINVSSWTRLQPLLEKFILKSHISGMDKGLDILLQWFEIISKSSDKINTFKSIVGLSPDMAEERKTRLSYSTSSISDLIEKNNEDKKRLVNEDDIYDYRNNKRMKVSRLLCNEDMNGADSKSDDEQSEGVEYDEENSCPDSFDSQSPEDGADEFGGSGDENNLQIDEESHHSRMLHGRRASANDALPSMKMAGHPQAQAQQQQLLNQKSAVAAAVGGIAPSPKQLMIIREKMLEYVQKNPSASRPSCIQVCQQPSSKVVWKNRRLDTPFKVKLDLKVASQMAGQNLQISNIVALGIVTDHKGKLQIDSVENFSEAFNGQGMAVFQGLKMTKGTWGKEWSLTFIAVARPSNSYNNSVVLSVSQPFAIVVKTRKNPQIRHNYSSASAVAQHGVMNSASENSSSSPEASPTMAPRRGRLPASAPMMSLQSRGASFPFSREMTSNEIRFPQDDMASLLWAAEIKQREHVPVDGEPEIIQHPLSPKNKYSSMILSPPKQTAVSTR